LVIPTTAERKKALILFPFHRRFLSTTRRFFFRFGLRKKCQFFADFSKCLFRCKNTFKKWKQMEVACFKAVLNFGKMTSYPNRYEYVHIWRLVGVFSR
jgi:hypothetical protein